MSSLKNSALIGGVVLPLSRHVVLVEDRRHRTDRLAGPGVHAVVSVFSLDIAEGRVQTIRGILNPDKLRHLGQVADVARLLGGGREGNSHT